MSRWDCPHPDTELRTRRINGGGIQYRHQCLTCGRSVGNAVSHSAVRELPPYWDDDREALWEASIRAQIQAERDEEAAQEATRRDAYRRYLASPQWAAKRRAVLERENFTCQGCRSSRACDVHHLTYAHIGNELLFELVALCRTCHETAHGGSSLDDAAI